MPHSLYLLPAAGTGNLSSFRTDNMVNGFEAFSNEGNDGTKSDIDCILCYGLCNSLCDC